MPMKLLAELAQAPLPRAFEDLDDIEKIRVLKAHGHVEANVPTWRFGFPIEPATVHAITALGRRALGDA
ncbi:hypothetical protein [Variovorax guangxiensis]|uniref:Uncharacterized protein n=1 Tax=Variovorax guangxiensis TaxID=1775474 RepID=A0A502DKX9_9BURK|nr:hypothetical protein [Variovorax guangxiensis]TPG21392.1 hypothetical protein EAH83_17600 [Variovorax ginsengisoli]TPG25442.1 hypothetical protein EAH82_18085 [Variovorax guangxiensis]